MDDLNKERVGSQTNILDNLNKFLRHENKWEMEEWYGLMTSNKYVKQSGFKPTIQQFRRYFEQVKIGFEYVRDTYGADSLPRGISIYQDVIKTGNLETADWVAFIPEIDQFAVSLLHIAGQCARYDHPTTVLIDNHLPKGVGVKAEDYTTLQAIEEGYHRYQQKVLKMKTENTMRDINHPLETGVVLVFQRAIKDLGIQTIEVN